MIIDCHTRIWESPAQLGRDAPLPPGGLRADEQRHRSAAEPVDRSIVLALKSRHLQAEIPNRLVADYARRQAGRVIGFAAVDPTDSAWLQELRAAHEELGLKGVVLSPALQNFHPADTRAMQVYEQCQQRGLPVVIEQPHGQAAARLEYADPVLLDEVAREFGELRLVITRLGHPWVEQTLALLAKHRNVFASLAGILPRPWLSYTALLAACEQNVLDKLLFGSDFPYHSPAACIEALYSVNQFAQASGLPPVPREQLRGIVERDALGLLGISEAPGSSVKARVPIFAADDE